MTTLPKSPNLPAKIVVAFLDGRRLKGHSYNFSALKDSFDIFPAQNSPQHRGTKVDLEDVKAVFFVKDFIGDPGHNESQGVAAQSSGKCLQVSFADGEVVAGTTQGYNPQKLGFFLTPINPKSNNTRIFVVSKSAVRIKPI